MELLSDFTHSSLSLLPPLLAIVLAIITHRVLLSLGVAIVVGTLLLNQFDPVASLTYLTTQFFSLFWKDGAPNAWNLCLIAFLLLLGMLTAFITRMGGSAAFGRWALKHIHSARQARLFTFFLGMLIFIDDYFNSLAVGQVARPVTDQFKVSRAKLAYLIDSTAAPVCLLSPFSSWGAFVMGILTLIIATHGLDTFSPLSAFISLLPFNFYPFMSLLIVGTVAYTGWGVGPMRDHQLKANLGQLFSHAKGPVPGEISKIPSIKDGHVRDLIIPIATLILSTFLCMIFWGVYQLHQAQMPIEVVKIFEHTDVASSLVLGAALALGSCVILGAQDHLTARDYGLIIRMGCKAMAPAIYILIFAWMIISIINHMGTGIYLSGHINETLPTAFLPAILFIMAAAMGFSTGSSWGTFGVIMPIAANVAMVVDPTLMMPMLAAVLSGALFGDHCSPISDTSILSSTGAGCHLMDHVITQIPYCVMKAIICLAAYLVYGYTRTYALALLTLAIGYVIALIFMRRHNEA